MKSPTCSSPSLSPRQTVSSVVVRSRNIHGCHLEFRFGTPALPVANDPINSRNYTHFRVHFAGSLTNAKRRSKLKDKLYHTSQ